MRLLTLAFFLAIAIQAAFADISIDALGRTVVFLRQTSQAIEMKDGKKVEVWHRDPDTQNFTPKLNIVSGTGLIIRYHGRDYLVTAGHVAKALSPKAEIVMNLSGGKTKSLAFEWIAQQKITTGATWFHHPMADISVHPLCYPAHFDQTPIDESLFPKGDTDVPLLTSAYILGFPLGQGVRDILSPLAKETQIASRLTSVDNPIVSPDLRFLLLDQALAQGYSGAPVFYTEEIMSSIRIAGQRMKGGEKLHFLGILSGGLSDATGGKISLVVPTSYLWDILESQEFTKYEENLKKKKD